jgi:hypothetical protein
MRSIAITSLVAVAGLTLGCSAKPTTSDEAAAATPATPTPATPTLTPIASPPTPQPATPPAPDAGSAAATTAPPELLDRAKAEATTALDRAYRKWRKLVTSTKRIDPALPRGLPDGGPTLEARDAKVEGDATAGWTITWSHHPPAGYEYDAVVKVGADGALEVHRAHVIFADR